LFYEFISREERGTHGVPVSKAQETPDINQIKHVTELKYNHTCTHVA